MCVKCVYVYVCVRGLLEVTVYMFYKNALLVLPQFFFAFLSLCSGQNFYYDLMYQSYNVFFTSLPIIALGVFDQASEARCIQI